jgi:integrase
LPAGQAAFIHLREVARISYGTQRCGSGPPRPRGLGLPRPQRRDYVYLTHAQALALADEAGRGRLLILLLAYTGLRWGEATALRVCDIDLDRRRVDVRRAFSDVGGRVILGTPKSHQYRTVPLPRFLAVELATAVVGKHADELVFTAPGGSVLRLPNWRRSVFIPARRRAGLNDRFRVHDLRHTAASLMKVSGVASAASFGSLCERRGAGL